MLDILLILFYSLKTPINKAFYSLSPAFNIIHDTSLHRKNFLSGFAIENSHQSAYSFFINPDLPRGLFYFYTQRSINWKKRSATLPYIQINTKIK